MSDRKTEDSYPTLLSLPISENLSLDNLDRLALLQDFAVALAGAVTVADVVERIVLGAARTLSASACSLVLMEIGATEAATVRMVNYPPEGEERFARFALSAPYPVAESMRTATPIFLETLQERDARYPSLVDIRPIGGKGAFAALPLIASANVVGGLGVNFAHDRKFETDERIYMQTIAQICAMALERARLYDAEREARAQAEREVAERHQAEAALRESEAHFRFLIEQSSDMITVISEAGIMLYLSPSSTRLTGYSLEERLGKSVFENVAPEDQPMVYEKFHSLFRVPSHTVTAEFRYRHKAGHWVYLECSARNMLTESSVRGIVINVRDITERKLAEFALRESDEKYRTLIEATKTGFVILDLDCCVVDANAEYVRLSGRARLEDILGHRVFEWIAPGDSLRRAMAICDSPSRGHVRNLELEFVDRLANRYPVEINSQVVETDHGKRILCLCRDISERVKTEQSLRYLMADAHCLLWHGTVEEYGSPILRWRLEMHDEAAAQRFMPIPVEPGQTYGQAWNACRVPEDQERTDRYGSQEVRAGRNYQQEFRCLTKDGSVRWLAEDVHVESVRPGLWRAVGVCTDITERKEAERCIQDQIAQINHYSQEIERQKEKLEIANAKLMALAVTDGLTGLYNHRAFQERIEDEFYRSVRYAVALSVVFLDVDNFKRYNDTYGHQAGDAVLQQVARVLQQSARGSDFVARYGGEEFVVILPETSATGAIHLAERFRKAIAKARTEGQPVTASFGVSSLRAEVRNQSQLILEADAALFAAKANGKNQVVHFKSMDSANSASSEG